MDLKIVILTCMHGRHDTVKYCLNKMPFIDKIVIYSKEKDGIFLEDMPIFAKAKYRNEPLSYKWNTALKTLKQVNYDAVILLGSDDYIDEKFLNYVSEKIVKFDMIGFTDLYFESDKSLYYWKGYQNGRKGEPAGAGKVYSRKYLESINYNLFYKPLMRGLDSCSWERVKSTTDNILITSLKQNNLKCVDVKDGEGMTDIKRIENLKLVKNV